MLADAPDVLSRSLGKGRQHDRSGQAVELRITRGRKIGAAGFVAGILLWSVLPGMVVRTLPESWLAPEWAASRIIGMD
jgi:hypothetical protein